MWPAHLCQKGCRSAAGSSAWLSPVIYSSEVLAPVAAVPDFSGMSSRARMYKRCPSTLVRALHPHICMLCSASYDSAFIYCTLSPAATSLPCWSRLELQWCENHNSLQDPKSGRTSECSLFSGLMWLSLHLGLGELNFPGCFFFVLAVSIAWKSGVEIAFVTSRCKFAIYTLIFICI